jgi:hypothetical protein
MKMQAKWVPVRILMVGVLLILSAAPALAHEHRDANGVSTVVGWDVEPAFAGAPNAAGIAVTQGEKGVEDLTLKAEILFGDKNSTNKTPAMDMAADFEDPSHYSVPFVPTRAGTYTFHVTGTVNGQPFDQYYTSGEKTFDDVDEAMQFPVKDPGPGELNRAIGRLDPRVTSADKTAKTAQTLAIVALVFGVIALALGRSRGSRRNG